MLNANLQSFKNDFKAVQNKQHEFISRYINILHLNLTATTNNFANILEVFDRQLNSTQEKQLELTSHVRNHGHGNKQRIDQLTSQIANFTNDFDSLNQKVTILQQNQSTLISREETLNMKLNQIERQTYENITDLSSQMNTTSSVRPSKITFPRFFNFFA